MSLFKLRDAWTARFSDEEFENAQPTRKNVSPKASLRPVTDAPQFRELALRKSTFALRNRSRMTSSERTPDNRCYRTTSETFAGFEPIATVVVPIFPEAVRARSV